VVVDDVVVVVVVAGGDVVVVVVKQVTSSAGMTEPPRIWVSQRFIVTKAGNCTFLIKASSPVPDCKGLPEKLTANSPPRDTFVTRVPVIASVVAVGLLASPRWTTLYDIYA